VANELAGATVVPALALVLGIADGLAVEVAVADPVAVGVAVGLPPFWCCPPNADWLRSVVPWLETAKTTPSVAPNATGIASATAIRAERLFFRDRRLVAGRWPVSIQSTSMSAVLAPGRLR
jgi:hypothetical protein